MTQELQPNLETRGRYTVGISKLISQVLVVGVFLLCYSYGLRRYAEYSNIFSYYIFSVIVGVFIVYLADYAVHDVGLKRLLFIVGFFCLSSVYILRGYVGTDQWTYRLIFDMAADVGVGEYFASSGIEKGYLFINYLLYRLFNGEFDNFQLVVSLLTMYFWGRGIWDNRRYVSMSMASFMFAASYIFLLMAADLFRIFLSAGIIFWGYKFVLRKETKKFVATILAAAIIHLSSLVLLPFLLLLQSRTYIYRHWKKFLIVMALLVGVGFTVLSRVAPLLGDRYSGYTVSEGRVSVLSFLSIFGFMVYAIYLRPYLPEGMRKLYHLTLILLGMTIIIKIVGIFFPFGRTVYYTTCGLMLITGASSKATDNSFCRTVMPAVFVLYGFIYMYVSCFQLEPDVTPLFAYNSYFDCINEWFGFTRPD